MVKWDVCGLNTACVMSLAFIPCLPDSLNCFVARFDDQNDNGAYSEIKLDRRAIVLKHHQVRSTSRRIEINKASGPDGVSGCTLRICADKLAGVFNLSLFLTSHYN